MKNTLIFLLLTIFFNCSSTKKVIKVECVTTSLPTIVRFKAKANKIWSIDIPIKMKIFNKSLKDRCFSSFKYLYGNDFKGGGGAMYIENNNKLYRVGRDQIKCIPFYDSKEYILYTRHYIDTLSSTQVILQSYIERMKATEQDTLIIGTLMEFKKNHREFVKQMLSKDTLRLHFDELESNGGGWSYVKLPIEF